MHYHFTKTKRISLLHQQVQFTRKMAAGLLKKLQFLQMTKRSRFIVYLQFEIKMRSTQHDITKFIPVTNFINNALDKIHHSILW